MLPFIGALFGFLFSFGPEEEEWINAFFADMNAIAHVSRDAFEKAVIKLKLWMVFPFAVTCGLTFQLYTDLAYGSSIWELTIVMAGLTTSVLFLWGLISIIAKTADVTLKEIQRLVVVKDSHFAETVEEARNEARKGLRFVPRVAMSLIFFGCSALLLKALDNRFAWDLASHGVAVLTLAASILFAYVSKKAETTRLAIRCGVGIAWIIILCASIFPDFANSLEARRLNWGSSIANDSRGIADIQSVDRENISYRLKADTIAHPVDKDELDESGQLLHPDQFKWEGPRLKAGTLLKRAYSSDANDVSWHPSIVFGKTMVPVALHFGAAGDNAPGDKWRFYDMEHTYLVLVDDIDPTKRTEEHLPPAEKPVPEKPKEETKQIPNSQQPLIPEPRPAMQQIRAGTIGVPANIEWLNTAIRLEPDQFFRVTSVEGTVCIHQQFHIPCNTADGSMDTRWVPRFHDMFLAPNYQIGGLVGKVDNYSTVTLGSGGTMYVDAPTGGIIYLSVNDTDEAKMAQANAPYSFSGNTGAFIVHYVVEVNP